MGKRNKTGYGWARVLNLTLCVRRDRHESRKIGRRWCRIAFGSHIGDGTRALNKTVEPGITLPIKVLLLPRPMTRLFVTLLFFFSFFFSFFILSVLLLLVLYFSQRWHRWFGYKCLSWDRPYIRRTVSFSLFRFSIHEKCWNDNYSRAKKKREGEKLIQYQWNRNVFQCIFS